VGPMARWKAVELPELAKRLRWAVVVSIVSALATGWLAGRISLGTTLGLWMTFWIVSTMAQDLWDKVKPPTGRPIEVLERLRRLPRATVGMMLAHLGVAAFAFGVSMVKTYETERDVQMNIGDTTEVGGYVFMLSNVREVQGPNFVAARAQMDITRGGKAVTTLFPEKRVYRVQSNPMTEAAIDAGITRDLYVSMGEQVESGAWIVRVYYKPFVDWIWGGCLIMAIGGALAASDRRYRRKVAEVSKTEGATKEVVA
jgi:cytochrome c-type biogenesis protein CcmF